VRTLINHTVYDLGLFRTMLSGGERPAPGAELIGDDWPHAYRSAAGSLLDAWRERGTDGTLKLPFGEVPITWMIGQHMSDIAVHGWDIARATGQPTNLDPEVGQAALNWARENLKPQLRGEAFAPEVPVPPDAPLYDRLAGFFGRDPAWPEPASSPR
jgi:uncharacterized protein (TIGR03086 family)